jgi:NAD(P)H-hydrate epimerase
MAAVKTGLLNFPAYSLVGKLELVGIGLAEEPDDPGTYPPTWAAIQRWVVNEEYVRKVLPERPLQAHKGTFGTALVVAGSANYTGAALLAGKAAYRSGAGLVTLAIPHSLHPALAGHFPEATWVLLPEVGGFIGAEAVDVVRENLDRATALLLGPGFGLHDATQGFLDKLLGLPGQTDFSPPVIDADGLKLLARLRIGQPAGRDGGDLHPGG